MQIDWLTVGAQWVNFLILMWLLQRFLYQPIVRAMDRRQQAMETGIEEARQKMAQAEREAEHYRDKLSELEAHRSVFMAAAREAADNERERLVKQARDEFEVLTSQWQRDVEREKTEFQHQLRNELGRLITATARKAVQDLAGLELEQALAANFLTRLNDLPAHDKRLLAESGGGKLVLATSFEPSDEMRRRYAEALRDALDENLVVSFEPLPDSYCGLMAITPAYTLEWRMEHYFEELDSALQTALALARQNKAGSHVE